MKKIISILFIILMLLAVCGCKSEKKEKTNNPQTETVESSKETVSEEEDESSLESLPESEETNSTEEETSTSVQPTALQFKDEILNDIGLTYLEINQKYGAETETDYHNGGRYYKFANSNIYFFFDTEEETAKPTDKSFLNIVLVKDVFNNSKEAILMADIENLLGTAESSRMMEDEPYCHSFIYKGYNISIYSESNTQINQNDFVWISK